MTSIRTATAVVATACTAVFWGASPATAVEQTPPPSSIEFVGQAVGAGAGGGAVKIRYTCTDDPEWGNHLYVAVKQGEEISTEESSSQYADAYYSSNWSVDAGPNALLCDGKPHTQTVVVRPDAEFASWNSEAAPLRAGTAALVQLCMYDVNGPSLDYTMQRVVGSPGR